MECLTRSSLRKACVVLCLRIACNAVYGETDKNGDSVVGTPKFLATPAQNGAVILSISDSTQSAVIHYTIDGASPTAHSPTYLAPILISSRLTIRAIAIVSSRSSDAATWTMPATVASGALVWSDEFTNPTDANTRPDPKVWGYDAGGDGWGNAELETYCGWDSSVSPCDRAAPNVYVGTDGCLHIVAEQPSSGVYTSARMQSQGRLSLLYGRIEARIRVPEAQGFWPAFWLLGNNISTESWPASGEIDIQERVNAAKTPDWNEGSIHGPGFTDANLGTDYHFPSGHSASDFHTYGVIWSPGKVQFYMDSPTNIYATYTPASLISLKGATWPFDSGNAQFILVNLAVGGKWPGKPSSTTPFPSEMLVDYVRVFAY